MDPIAAEILECAGWSDAKLTRMLEESARQERLGLVSLLIRLGEFFNRDLSLKKGFPSVYEYCIRELGFSRTAAHRRIASAKTARRFPSVLNMLANAELSLTVVAMLSRHLTPENHQGLLRRARKRQEVEVERIIAELSPVAGMPRESIRPVFLSTPSPAPVPPAELFAPEGAPSPTASSPAEALLGAPPEAARSPEPDAEPDLYSITFPASRETRALLLRAKELLRHRFPRAETDAIVNLALDELVSRLDRSLRKTARPSSAGRTRSRYVPEAVKQEALRRDEQSCSFVGPEGRRCGARAWLQFDHKTPYALGGASDDPGNIRMLCGAHNRLAWKARRAAGDGVLGAGKA